jgi:ABC-type polysaccharide/polyol phosphate transport system ATPase subunit
LPTSPSGTVEVRHLWKRFRGGRRLVLRDHVERVGARLRGSTDSGWRWALRDVNLRIEPGEAVGLVGRNGSGKSTLLKILTRVMYPYAGSVAVAGRVGALIEVQAGLHEDLTGRENILLYGSLLGWNRREVARRFDDIVDFAELHDAVDRQVKFYSSGMHMRLGFSVAALLEPDVLLVDEVLAVGDGAFQVRCLDRMKQVIAGGTTLVYVSHDLATVRDVCGRVLWVDDGRVRADGHAGQVLVEYASDLSQRVDATLSRSN